MLFATRTIAMNAFVMTLCLSILVVGLPDRDPQFLTRVREIIDDINEKSVHHVIKREIANETSEDNETMTETLEPTYTEINIEEDLDERSVEEIMENPGCLRRRAVRCMLYAVRLLALRDNEPEFCDKVEFLERCVDKATEPCTMHLTDAELEEIALLFEDRKEEVCVFPTQFPELSDEQAVIRCFGGNEGALATIESCQSYAYFQLLKEDYLINTLSDTVCLAAKHLMTCASQKMTNKCGRQIAREMYNHVLFKVVKNSDAKFSQYCLSVSSDKVNDNYRNLVNKLYS